MGAPVYPGKGGGRWLGGVIARSPPTLYSAVMPMYPPPDVPECAATGTHAAAAADCRGDLGGAGREGGKSSGGHGRG